VLAGLLAKAEATAPLYRGGTPQAQAFYGSFGNTLVEPPEARKKNRRQDVCWRF
jgi:hypothetical protein